MNESKRRTGTVVSVFDRGFFFILYEGRHIFCHASKWLEVELPSVNDAVTFEIIPATKPQYRFEAVNVRPVQRPTTAALDVLSGKDQSDAEKAGHGGAV